MAGISSLFPDFPKQMSVMDSQDYYTATQEQLFQELVYPGTGIQGRIQDFKLGGGARRGGGGGGILVY